MGDFFKDIREFFPNKILSLLVVTTVSGFLEGLSLLLLYPFFSLLIDGRLPREGRIIPPLADAWRSVAGEPSILSLGALILAVTCLQYGTRVLQSWLSSFLQAIYINGLRKQLFAALLATKWAFLIDTKSGELTNALTVETQRCLYVLQYFVQFVACSINALMFIAVAALISFDGTAALLGMALLIGVVCHRYVRRSYVVGRDLTNFNEAFSGWISDVLANMKFFKATASEDVARRRGEAIVDDMLTPFVWSSFGPQLVRSIVEFVAIVMFLGFLIFGIKVLRLDMAAVLVIIGVFVRLLPRLAVALESVQTVTVYLAAVAKVRSLRQRATGNAEREEGPAGPGFGNRDRPAGIEVRHLTVRYGAHAVLRDVSLVIPPGSLVAIIGASGAGKTTLIDCLLGLVETDEGEILIDGERLTRDRLGAWRRSVGYQGQDTMMLNASLRDNIVWAEAAASEEQIDEAARKAGVGAFIAGLPEGYATPSGERGCKLSGGQRQRIGLARAMLSHRRLLILDEATSALDGGTEREVMDNIRQLKGEITIVMITHRLAIAQQADTIYVLDHGRLVQQGRWDELALQDGTFRELQDQQADVPREHS